MPGGEIGEQPPDSERHRVDADRGPRDAADLLPHPQRVRGPGPAELPAPRLVGYFAAVRLTVHENVDVLEAVVGARRPQERDWLIPSRGGSPRRQARPGGPPPKAPHRPGNPPPPVAPPGIGRHNARLPSL